MSVKLRGQQINKQLVNVTSNEPCNFSDEGYVPSSRKADESKVITPLEANLRCEARIGNIELCAEYSVPDKYMMGSNLNNLLPDYRNKRKEKKNLKEINFWQQKINQQLELYHLEDDKYNIKLVRGLCQIVEKYICYDTHLGSAKKTIVMNCCLKFFDDNVPLLESIIENELEHIKKSGFVMRALAKLEIFFFANR